MASDLVQRLRSGVYGLNRIPLCEEAATRIEQLEAQRSQEWVDYKLTERLEDAGLVVFPAQCDERELTSAQGALMDVSWDAIECFAARMCELYRVTRHRVGKTVAEFERAAAERRHSWVSEAMVLADKYAEQTNAYADQHAAQQARAALLAHLTGETK